MVSASSTHLLTHEQAWMGINWQRSGCHFSFLLYIYKYIQITKNQKNSEILLNKNNKCLFSYLYTLTFTVKGFKVIYKYIYIYIYIFFLQTQLNVFKHMMGKLHQHGLMKFVLFVNGISKGVCLKVAHIYSYSYSKFDNFLITGCYL